MILCPAASTSALGTPSYTFISVRFDNDFFPSTHSVFVRMTGILDDGNNVWPLLRNIYEVTTTSVREFDLDVVLREQEELLWQKRKEYLNHEKQREVKGDHKYYNLDFSDR